MAELRQRVLELGKSEAERKRTEQEAQEARSYAESIINKKGMKGAGLGLQSLSVLWICMEARVLQSR
ncbi:MAG: hypothetical protein OIN66_06840 [Candidatus Methanoperedens sp.]|nr:hypothetical protein [Candidatus Methanoperedens sp.]